MRLRATAVALCAMLAAAGYSSAAALELVSGSQPRCVLVVGDQCPTPERSLAAVLQARIRKRTGCTVPIVAEKGARGAPTAVLIGAPQGNALARRLCQQAGKLVPTPKSVGPGGYVVHTLDRDGTTWAVLAGSDSRGTACAVGKFLRAIDFSGRDATVPRLAVVDKIDPATVMECMQYKPAQWGNAFKDAPIERIREYIEDMALWGSTSLWNVCCYMINDPFKPDADATSRRKWERVRDLFKYAHSLGLRIGYVDCPNSVYDDQLGLRKLGGTFRYREDVCPSIPQVRRVLLANREHLARAAREAGIEFDSFLYFAHDNGGCDCERCKPWIRTFLALSHEMHRLAVTHHPRLKIYLTTWMCSGAEKRMMLDFIRDAKPPWVAGVMDRPGVSLPEPYVSVGWLTIFAYGAGLSYGKKGANPLPLFLPPRIQEYHKRGLRAVLTYSEGIYDDFNTALVAQVCRHPFRTAPRKLLIEYAHANFGTRPADSAALADLVLAKFKGAAHDSIRPTLRVEDPTHVLAALEALEQRMPPWGREGWRYGVLKARVQLEVLDEQARALAAWGLRLEQALGKAVAQDDDALGDALAKAKADLAELQATAGRLAAECAKLTRHLYVDLYGSPNRHAAHGSFRLPLPPASLLARVAQQCDALASERDAARRRQGVAELLERLRNIPRPGARAAPRETARVPRHLALGRKAAASSVYDHRFPASRAVDGKPIVTRGASENCWASARGQAQGAWWQVDLGKRTPIREVRVWFRNIWDRGYAFVPKSITFQVSDDGAAWRTVLSKATALPKEGAPYGKTPSVFALTAQGRHLRLLFEDGSQNREQVVELTEVEVH